MLVDGEFVCVEGKMHILQASKGQFHFFKVVDNCEGGKTKFLIFPFHVTIIKKELQPMIISCGLVLNVEA